MVLEFLQKIPDFGFGVIQTGDVFGIILILMWIIMGLVVLGGVGYFLWTFSRYRYEVGIFAKRGASWVFVKDRARIIRGKEGKKMIFLKTKGRSVIPPELEFENPKKPLFFSVFSQTIIFFEQYGRENFAPLRLESIINPGGIQLTPTEMHIDNWANAELWNIHRKYQKEDFMSKYGQVISVIGIAIMVVVVTWILMGGMQDIAQIYSQAAESFAKATQASAPGGLG